jgi:hypothetical protein
MAAPLLYPWVSGVPNSPPSREILVPEQMHSPHSSLNSPSATQCTTINTCSKLKEVQHAIASALNNHEATVTFLLLPHWMENSTIAFVNPAPKTIMFAIIFANFPKKQARYNAICHFSTSNVKHHPCQKQRACVF